MTQSSPFTYPLTTRELHDALARGRMERSAAFLGWLGHLVAAFRKPERVAPHGGTATPSLG